MAPGRKRTRAAAARDRAKASARNKRVDAFLKDFDREVQSRLAEMWALGQNLKKEMENMYDMELLRLPPEMRQMNWITVYGLGGSDKALERAASSEVEIPEMTQLASGGVQKAGPAKGNPSPQPAEGPPQKLPLLCSHLLASLTPGEASPSARQAPRAASRVGLVEALGLAGHRVPSFHERIFSISVNGSPLADKSEGFLTVPLDGGERIRIGASELLEKDLLNAQALGSVKKLLSQLSHLCSQVGSHK